MSSLLLPFGLILVFSIAWFAPEPGQQLEQWGLIPWMAGMIFLTNGYQTRLQQLPGGSRIWQTALIAIAINLLISPFLGLLTASVLNLPTGAALGLIVISAVPATLSIGTALTYMAGGDGVKALFLTILLNLLGVFTVPFMLHLVLDNVGIITLSPWPLLQQLVSIVLLPFLAGMLARNLLGISPRHLVIRYLPTVCVTVTVWMSVSASSETLRELSLPLTLLIILSILLLHGSLMLLCLLSRRLHNPGQAEWLALLFTSSQKTLPVAIGVLSALSQPVGLAMVVCVLFHFTQLFTDSILAARLGKSNLPQQKG